MKKFISLFLAASMLCTNIYAQETGVFADGIKIENAKIIENNSVDMLPVRAVAEALGYNVSWNNETKSVVVENVPGYYTFSIGTDGYTRAKTAAMPLGQPPVLENGVTYVPVSFFTELMEYEAEIDDDYINFITEKEEEIITEDLEEKKEKLESVVEISSIDKDNNRITVEDEIRGTVVLALSEETIDIDGNPVNIEDFSEGDKIDVEYSEAMTMSLPPINNPVSVSIHKEKEGRAEVISIDEENSEIIVKDDVLGEVRLNISEETVDIDGNPVNIEDFSEGSSVEVEYSEAMTKSIPPLNTPVSVTILK